MTVRKTPRRKKKTTARRSTADKAASKKRGTKTTSTSSSATKKHTAKKSASTQPASRKSRVAKAPAKTKPAKRKRRSAQDVGKQLSELGRGVVEQIQSAKTPSIQIPVRSLSNVLFDEKRSIIELGDQTQDRALFNVGQARKFMQTFLVASACKDLLEANKTTSIRDLYYITKHTIAKTRQNTFEDQEESDPIIEDIEVTVDALREEMNLFASNRGSMVGEMTLVDSGDTIDLRRLGSGGWSIPSIVEDNVIQFKKCDAKMILLVEKDAVWRRLNEDKFWKKHKAILMHGNGMAPRGVRRLCHRMVSELKLPLYVLVDNDPWGFYIYSVVKQGSINLAYESQRMAVPQARFLGLSSFDAETFALPSNVSIKLDDTDVKRAKQMMSYAWFDRREWQREMKRMLREGVKFELEALSAKGISFISEEYLPRKIRNRQYLV
jgi:DNA topoisomerase-6 subunit A